ncbi:tRNA 2-selenouridine(34) synthase MnmH [Pedobacter immunditicola]|uniref:tRNA 2-selenouridine(34) synthase MnmH n=1 Tax=Pedobacter immunditicola TaxID=3133440 RepID=UPI0030AA4B75
MVKTIAISDYILSHPSVPLIDVRTPAEYAQGHIPDALNIPLFTNEERIAVGTTYKKVGREEAILLGFDLTGNKWSGFIQQALSIAPKKKIAVHCWRGGMRSGAMAWALDLYGFEVYLIQGGYKSYRGWALNQFTQPFNLKVLGGMTGSNKTSILHELQLLNEQVLDLEELAQHQGSSYGTMNKMVQPTQEQFENNFAFQLSKFNGDKPIWVEDESLTIGKRCIPHPFYNQMRNSVLIKLDVSLEQRIDKLTKEYGVLDKDFLIACTERIRKRLGPEQTKSALQAIQENRMEDFIALVLYYYDKTYHIGLNKRDAAKIFTLNLELDSPANNAKKVLAFANSLHQNLELENNKDGIERN